MNSCNDTADGGESSTPQRRTKVQDANARPHQAHDAGSVSTHRVLLVAPDSPAPQGAAYSPSPLAGYLADPNLAVLDGVFVLYPTTDGTPDWAGTSFSAYSSPDLVAWIDHGVILDLETQVSWAKVE